MSRTLKTLLLVIAVVLVIGLALHVFAAPFMRDVVLAIHGR